MDDLDCLVVLFVYLDWMSHHRCMQSLRRFRDRAGLRGALFLLFVVSRILGSLHVLFYDLNKVFDMVVYIYLVVKESLLVEIG